MFTQLNPLPSKEQVPLFSPCFQRRRLRNVEIAQPVWSLAPSAGQSQALWLWSLCGPETALLHVEHRARSTGGGRPCT